MAYLNSFTPYTVPQNTQPQEQQPAINEQGTFGDSVDAFQAGALSAVGGILDFAGAEGFAKNFYGWADDQYSQMSQAGRESMGKQIFTTDEDGNFSLGEGATDLDTWLLGFANMAGQFLPTAIPGAGAAGVATRLASFGSKGKAVANAAGMGAFGGAAGTGQGMEEARNEYMQIPDTVKAESELFKAAIRNVHKQNPDWTYDQKWDAADAMLAEQIASDVRSDPKVLLANFGASAIGDPIIGKALMGARLAKSGAMRSAVKGFAIEGSTEAAQAGVTQYGINEALQPVDGREAMDGVAVAAANEGVLGGAFGGVAGGIGGAINRQPKVRDPAADAIRESNPALASAFDDIATKQAEANSTIQQLIADGSPVAQEATPTQPDYVQQRRAEIEQAISDLDTTTPGASNQVAELNKQLQFLESSRVFKSKTELMAGKSYRDAVKNAEATGIPVEIVPVAGGFKWRQKAPAVQPIAAQPVTPLAELDTAAQAETGSMLAPGNAPVVQSDPTMQLPPEISQALTDMPPLPEVNPNVAEENAGVGEIGAGSESDIANRSGDADGIPARDLGQQQQPRQPAAEPLVDSEENTLLGDAGSIAETALIDQPAMSNQDAEMSNAVQPVDIPQQATDTNVVESNSDQTAMMQSPETDTAPQAAQDAQAMPAINPAMQSKNWAAETDSESNNIWTKAIGQERYRAELNPSTGDIEVTAQVNGVNTQIGTVKADDRNAADTIENIVTEDASQFSDATTEPVAEIDANTEAPNSDQVTQISQGNSYRVINDDLGKLAKNGTFKVLSIDEALGTALVETSAGRKEESLTRLNRALAKGGRLEVVTEPTTNQTPADAGVSVSEPAAKPTPRTSKLQDVGATLVANKKSWFSGKGLKWSDIAGENDTLKLKLATKSKVWAKPNWESIINSVPDAEQETFAPIVHMVKQVYDAISTKPAGKSDQNIQDYIEVVSKVKDAAESLLNDKDAQAKLWADLGARAERRLASPYSIGTMAAKSDMAPIFAKVFPIVAGGSRFKRGERENDLAGQIGNKAVKAMQFDAGTAAKALQDISKGWPAKQEAWQKQGYAVIELDGKPEPTVGEIKRPDGTVYSARVGFKSVDGVTFREFLGTYDNKQEADKVAKAYASLNSKPVLLISKRKSIVSSHDDVDTATEAARAITRRNTGSEVKEQPLQAEDVERVGVERRQGGRDATAQELMDSFGFTGINFGNWVKGDERQWFVNQAYDSFYDLAETLGLPPKAMSLNGMLGIAFGAQGNSGAAAHFVPGFNEINLTKNQGAGALAHEWGHALDHYFGVMSGMAKTDEPFASELPNLNYRSKQTVKEKLDTPDGIRQVIHDAFIDITSQLKSKQETMEEYQARIKENQKRYAAEFDSLVKPFESKLSAKGKAALKVLRDGTPGDYVSIPPPKGKRKSPGVVYDEVMQVANDLPEVFSDLRMIDALNNKAAMVKLTSERFEAEPLLAKVHTDFYAKSRGKDASKGGKVYWSTPVEMFARAFESYVMDQMAEKGQRNDFLVRPGKQDQGQTNPEYPYPAGIERQDFNAAFNKLIDAIETKETEKGTMLFSKANFDTMRNQQAKGVSPGTLEVMVKQFMKKLNNAAGIKVEVLRNQQEAELKWNMSLSGSIVRGAYDDTTKTAYLIAGNFDSIEHARRTLAHEVIAHGGFCGCCCG